MNAPLLDGELVLAVAEASDGALARLLASLGATVRRIELRQLLADSAQLLAPASFLLDQRGLASLAADGVRRVGIEAVAPRLIHVSVSPFGSSGPRSLWRGGELVASAMGGTLRLTGEPDRAPVKEALDACFFHADMVAAAGALLARYERGDSGIGQHVDVSVQEVAFSRNVNGILVWQFDRRKLHRVGGALNYGRATVRCIWRLADGWCFHSLLTGRFGAPANQALSDWMDANGLDNPLRGTDWTRYNRSTLEPATRVRWEQALAAFFASRTRADIAGEGRRRGINATVVAEPADVLADPHLRERDFWQVQGTRRLPRRFASMTPGPALAPTARSAPPPSAAPLAGVRVLDFSWALVGSITTKTLGDFGADVIKVESRTRPCLSRIDVQVGASRAGNFDDKPWFAHLNSSKRSLALDMKHPESRVVLEPLLDWADVVVENFSPGTMAKLGLDYATLAARRPGLIMVSGSVFGQTGARAQEWGVDGTGAALSGRTYLTGWADRDPVIPGAVPYGDVIVPYVMAAMTAAALEQRRRTSRGCHIDASMYEICAQQMYAGLLAAQRGEHPRRRGNDDPAIFHQGVYATAGADRWIAISCFDTEDWLRLQALAALPDCAAAAARHQALARWTHPQSARTLMTLLQGHGIAAGEVQDVEDMLEHDPQLAARGALMSLEHPLLGAFGHVRTPVTLSRSPVAAYRPPQMGEHSTQIAADIARLSQERIIQLLQAQVFQ